MSILVLLNVTLIEVDWPMPCWRTLSGLHGLTFSKLKPQFQETCSSPGLRCQFQHEAWRHHIEHRYNQVVLQLANWLLGHSSFVWSEIRYQGSSDTEQVSLTNKNPYLVTPNKRMSEINSKKVTFSAWFFYRDTHLVRARFTMWRACQLKKVHVVAFIILAVWYLKT